MSKKKNTGKQGGLSKNKPADKKKAATEFIHHAEYEQTLSPLMPELEELVKKNPNRLIGCGG